MKGKLAICAALFASFSLYGCDKHDDQQKASIPAARTVEWYQAHPDALGDDEKKCAGETPSLSREDCQRVYSADSAIGEQEMHSAAQRNNAAASPASQGK